MENLNQFLPIVIGLVLTWFVVLGALELVKEASGVVFKKTNA